MLVLGLDGCGDGWLVVALRAGAFDSATFAPSLARALEAHPSAEVVAIDIPIGAEADRFRTVDGIAKRLLGSRGSTLFEMPPMKVLRQPSFEAALALCRKLTGKGLSRQAFALRDKILEVEPVAARDGRIIEVHPELCFRALASEAPIERKKSWDGLVRRRRLLEGVGIRLPDALGEAGRRAAPDDVVDAAAAAWTAERRRRGVAECIGSGHRGRAGRTPAIWF
jgi:predicted RNase H-like nuclease